VVISGGYEDDEDKGNSLYASSPFFHVFEADSKYEFSTYTGSGMSC
jgi:hypothetical protein